MKLFITILLTACVLNIQAQHTIRITLAGEVNVGNNYGVTHRHDTDVAKLFDHVTPLLKAADVSVATLGTVLIDIDAAPNRANLIGTHKLIRVSESYATALHEAGFTALSLANSHVADFGIEGIQTTTSSLRAAGIEYAGVKAMQDYKIFEHNGMKCGFIAFGTSVHTLSMADSTLIRNMVTSLNDQCDIVIVAFSNNPQPTTTYRYTSHSRPLPISFAHTCIDAGADIVLGNGQHLPQPLELYRDRLIVYGLGNFCTPYGVSYTGELGNAPLVEATLYADGTFQSGHIASFRQKNTQGPTADPTHEAARLLKSLTSHHFPDTKLSIDDTGNIVSTSESAYAIAMKLLTEAERHRGKRYQMGATGPNRFDCSGFTSYVFAKFGIKLNRMSAAQYTQGEAVDRKDLRPGDLVFFTRSSVRGVGHVGIVYSVDKQRGSFKFIHAAVSTGITISDFASSAYYIKRYVGARRILPYDKE